MNPYEKLQARKRKWTPVKPVAGICKEGAEETIHRALALRHMELPVGDFITKRPIQRCARCGTGAAPI